MMDFLSLNQEIKFIPDDIREISVGKLDEICSNSFKASFKNKHLLKQGSSVEALVPAVGVLYRFNTKILNIEENYAVFSIPNDFKIIQRRQYIRVKINLPIYIKNNYSFDDSIEAQTVNLSGGGIQFKSSCNFPESCLLDSKLVISANNKINSVIEVLRTETSAEDKDNYYFSCSFKEISVNDSTAIIQLCFKRQLELQCNGIGCL